MSSNISLPDDPSKKLPDQQPVLDFVKTQISVRHGFKKKIIRKGPNLLTSNFPRALINVYA
jgi:hypothetical protein